MPKMVVWMRMTRMITAVNACVAGSKCGTKMVRVSHGANSAPVAESKPKMTMTSVSTVFASRIAAC